MCRLRAVRNKMARWLPNFEDLFLSLGRLIENSEEQLNSASCDTSELLFRRLEEYERTLSNSCRLRRKVLSETLRIQAQLNIVPCSGIHNLREVHPIVPDILLAEDALANQILQDKGSHFPLHSHPLHQYRRNNVAENELEEKFFG